MSEAFVTVVGTHFRGSEAKQAVNALVVGETDFQFEREPDNEYDANAIQVIHAGEFIGYLARANNHNLAAALDAGAEFTARMIDWEGRKPVLQISWDG